MCIRDRLIDRSNLYDVDEAVAIIKKSASAKFDETVEVHIRTGCDGRHADQQIRGAVVLPHGTGKKVRVLVFAKGDKAAEAQAAGAEFVGGEELVPRIQKMCIRDRSGLMYTLMQALSLGHVYLPEEELLREASALLGVEEKLMEKHIMDLLMDKKVIMKEKDHQRCIYSAQYYYMELNTAKMLHDLNIQCDMEEEEIEKRLKKVEKEFDIILDEKQHRAVVESVKNGLDVYKRQNDNHT